MTGRVRDMIMEPKETGKLSEVIAEGTYYGMQTFDQSLLRLYNDGKISMEEALKAATHPHDFKLLVASGGIRSTSVEQILEEEEQRPSPGNGQDPQTGGTQPEPSHEPGTPPATAVPDGSGSTSVSPPGADGAPNTNV